MKLFKYKGVEYKTPTSWDEITLEKQIEVRELSEEFTNETTKKLALLAAYANMPIEVIKKSTPQEIGPLFKHLAFIGEEIPVVEVENIMTFNFKGEEYCLAQNLMEQEFQDFISLETALGDNENDVYKALPLIIAIMAKKEGESLDDYNVEERAELFKLLPIALCQSIAVFFYNVVTTYTNSIQLFSNPNQLIQTKADEVEDTLNKLVGQGSLTRFQTGILKLYLKSIRQESLRSFTSTPQKSLIKKWKAMFMK